MPALPRETPVAVGLISDIWSLDHPQTVTLRVIRGDALRLVLRLCESVEAVGCGSRGVSPQTLDGLEARATIRPSQSHVLYTPLTCVVDETVGSGRITITATPEVTRLGYDWGGVWSVELVDSTDPLLRKTIVTGPVDFDRSVTT